MHARAPVGVGLLAVAACSFNDDVPAPAISAVIPDHGVAGILVTVTGSYLCQQPRTGGDDDPLACAHVGGVMFDTIPAIATAYTDTTVMAEVPMLPAGRSSVIVAVAGRSSNSIGFVTE